MNSKRTTTDILCVVLLLALVVMGSWQPLSDSLGWLSADIAAQPVYAATQELSEQSSPTTSGGKPLFVYLTRHGQTITNVTQRFVSDIGSSPLTDSGKNVARFLGVGLSNVSFKAAYCTSKSRTKETAQIVLSENRSSPYLNIIEVAALREGSGGVHESMTNQYLMEELKFTLTDEDNEQKKLWDQFLKNDTTGLAEGYDKWFERVIPAFKNICEAGYANGGGNILVVAHGGVNRMLGEYFSGKMQPGAINSSVILIEYNGGDDYKVHTYNDTSYIDAGRTRMENPAPLEVHLIVHGQTLMDELGWLNSIVDSPLADAGKAQMSSIGKKLTSTELFAVYASDLFVDIDSAKAVVAENSKNPNLVVNTNVKLRAVSLGFYEGMTLKEAKPVIDSIANSTANGTISTFFSLDKTKTAESYDMAKERIMKAFYEICQTEYARGGGAIAVVSNVLAHQLIAEELSLSNTPVKLRPGDTITVRFDGSRYTIAAKNRRGI